MVQIKRLKYPRLTYLCSLCACSQSTGGKKSQIIQFIINSKEHEGPTMTDYRSRPVKYFPS